MAPDKEAALGGSFVFMKRVVRWHALQLHSRTHKGITRKSRRWGETPEGGIFQREVRLC